LPRQDEAHGQGREDGDELDGRLSGATNRRIDPIRRHAAERRSGPLTRSAPSDTDPWRIAAGSGPEEQPDQ
jgi:hypothetical protein